MKNINKLIVIFLTLILIVCTGCKSSGKSLNVKIMETDRSTVRFRPVCPECEYVGQSQTIEMYDGEGDIFTDIAVCEDCWHVFDIGITRN